MAHGSLPRTTRAFQPDMRNPLVVLAAALAAGSGALGSRLLHREAGGAAGMNETLSQAASRIPFFRIGAENNLKFIRNSSDPMYAKVLGQQYQVRRFSRLLWLEVREQTDHHPACPCQSLSGCAGISRWKRVQVGRHGAGARRV